MARVKLKEKDNVGRKLVGRAIFNAWEAAIKANPESPKIDRQALVAALKGIFDTEDRGKSGKRIEVDVVFDTDLDDNTRLVWISIPTPDVAGAATGAAWQTWKEEYYDNLTPAEQEQKEEELGAAVLFGCGR